MRKNNRMAYLEGYKNDIFLSYGYNPVEKEFKDEHGRGWTKKVADTLAVMVNSRFLISDHGRAQRCRRASPTRRPTVRSIRCGG